MTTTIVTLGPAILNAEKLSEIDRIGDCIYRINGAHANAAQARFYIDEFRAVLPEGRLMIDLPGNKIRVTDLVDPIRLVKGQTFELHASQLTFPPFCQFVTPGDVILANDSIYRLEVEERRDHVILLRSHSDGFLQNNKGLHLKGASADIPFLFERDLELIQCAVDADVDYLSLSYVRTAEDVLLAQEEIRRRGTQSLEIISKLETASAVTHAEAIMDVSTYVNVDRGDLSTDIGLAQLPPVVHSLVQKARARQKGIFLATQFLTSMLESPVPTIAEIMDLAKTYQWGIEGIQLSEETAVGQYPAECVRIAVEMSGYAADAVAPTVS